MPRADEWLNLIDRRVAMSVRAKILVRDPHWRIKWELIPAIYSIPDETIFRHFMKRVHGASGREYLDRVQLSNAVDLEMTPNTINGSDISWREDHIAANEFGSLSWRDGGFTMHTVRA